MRRKPRSQVEQSILLRWLVLCATWWAMLTMASVSGIWPTALIMGVAVAIGHWYSARHLGAPDTRLRLTLGVLLVLALAAMYADITIGVFGGAVPQAKFGIWAQVITSFELRTRRNLYSTTLHSFVIMYAGALLSFDATFGFFLLVFLLLCGALLVCTYVTDVRASGASIVVLPEAGPVWLRQGVALVAGALSWLVAIALVAGGVFLFQPRFPGRQLFSPISVSIPVDEGYRGQILNPAFALVHLAGRSKGNTGYFGLNSNLDLRYRQRPSADVVMYVRSPVWSYWRGMTFDHYTGVGWEITDLWTQPLPLTRSGAFAVSPDNDSETGMTDILGRDAVQTFYFVQDMPNIVYTAYWPHEVSFPSPALFMDSSAGLRASTPLKAGTTYSILSRVPTLDPAALRSTGSDYPSRISAAYLQLPAISPRVRQLARDITEYEPTPYDKMLAIDRMLRSSCLYDLLVPVLPPGKEATDQFLFVDKRGYCEQFGTAEVVLARVVGIPARLVAGYSSGDYQAMTGLYTVRASDAHAWAEVYFPGAGWIPFDASAAAPANPTTRVPSRWLLPNMAVWSASGVRDNLSRVAQSVLIIFQGMAAIAFRLVLSYPLLLIGAVGTVLLIARMRGVHPYGWWQKARGTSLESSSVARSYRQGVAAIAKSGLPMKRGSQTPHEYYEEVASIAGDREALRQLTDLALQVVYDQQSESSDETGRAAALAKSLRRQATTSRPPREKRG